MGYVGGVVIAFEGEAGNIEEDKFAWPAEYGGLAVGGYGVGFFGSFCVVVAAFDVELAQGFALVGNVAVDGFAFPVASGFD